MLFFPAFVLLALTACVNPVTLPSNPIHPQQILLVDYGRHSALVLPRPDGSAVEYAGGEYEWCAKANDQWYRIPVVVFLPVNDSALGRREIPGPDALTSYRIRQLHQALYVLTVSADKVTQLLTKLDNQFQQNIHTQDFNPKLDMHYVKVSDVYWGGHNCNHATASWLRDLDCQLSGSNIYSSWLIKYPQSDSAPSSASVSSASSQQPQP